MKAVLVAAVAALAAGAALLLSAGSASARPCPPGTVSTYVTSAAGHAVYACLPPTYPQCDPGPCPSMAPPRP